MEKYQNLYRTKTTRAQWHNYACGTYFITICTQAKMHYFGNIITNPYTEENEMQLSIIGEHLRDTIIQTNNIWIEDGISIPLYTIMPNHVHLIVRIEENYKTPEKNEFKPQSNNLASIIRGIKSKVTSIARNNGIQFGWQSRYHDHIIKDYNELNSIASYIENNVANWETDCFHFNSKPL